jgi:branched-chain amino acid transport system ATP-binding protein
VAPAAGRIRFRGEDVTAVRPERRVALGICQVPEGRRIFANLSVRENLQMGAYLRPAAERRGLERTLELFPRLRERLGQNAGTLSGGEQQMLAIGRALMAEPALLLLDEPSLGLAPLLVQQIFGIVAEINAQGTTVVLVEQNARQALRVAQRAYVLETGELALEGGAAELARDPRVREAYLGERADGGAPGS